MTAQLLCHMQNVSLVTLLELVWSEVEFPSSLNRPISQIPECACPISHNAPLRTEMCTFLFWMVHCGIWDRCIVGFVDMINCDPGSCCNIEISMHLAKSCKFLLGHNFFAVAQAFCNFVLSKAISLPCSLHYFKVIRLLIWVLWRNYIFQDLGFRCVWISYIVTGTWVQMQQ